MDSAAPHQVRWNSATEAEGDPPMRYIVPRQRRLVTDYFDHQITRELQEMSNILDEHPELLELVMKDLTKKGAAGKGRPGLSAEQVLRVLVLKMLDQETYRELSFRLQDSTAYSAFCRLGLGVKRSASALHESLRRVQPETLEAVNRVLIGGNVASGRDKDKATKVRIDCTVTATNIHDPSDSSLLWDCVRVLTRILERASNALPGSIVFTDHRRRAKKRSHAIQHAKNEGERKILYQDLLRVVGWVQEYVDKALPVIKVSTFAGLLGDLEKEALLAELDQYAALTRRVVSQTARRVLNGEQVPAQEKVVSIFESHTDIIKKERRDTEFGHKICLSVGSSSLVYDCAVLEGNPADSTLATEMIERHIELFGRPPRKAAFDGGFASKTNLQGIKALGVKDVAFNKKRGIEVEDMTKSTWVYRQLSRFRAGVEGVISYLKRCFGLRRCNWKGFDSFKAYVWSSIIAANLLTMARRRLA